MSCPQKCQDTLKNLRDLMLYYLPVAQDYMCALKMRNVKRVQELWWHLLALFGQFNVVSYVRPMLYTACQMEWLRRENHTVWQFIQTNMAAFDEERGEVSFAMLRSCVIKDSDLGNRAKLALNYKLLPLVSETEADFQTDANGKSFCGVVVLLTHLMCGRVDSVF